MSRARLFYRYARATQAMREAFETSVWPSACQRAERLRLRLPAHVQAVILPHWSER
jgi:hypothetical protein